MSTLLLGRAIMLVAAMAMLVCVGAIITLWVEGPRGTHTWEDDATTRAAERDVDACWTATEPEAVA